jgi:hypothetical protein
MNITMEDQGKYRHDKLLAGDFPRSTEPVTIQTGLQLKKGTVLGKVTAVVPSTGTAGGGNTGNGLVTTVAGQYATKAGTYTLNCIAAALNGGTFEVLDPDGISLPDALVGSYSGTGDGTLTYARLGVEGKTGGYYSVKCITAVTNGGVFEVRDPDGILLGTVTIPPGAGADVEFNHPQIRFRLTDGATDFVVNDEFLIAPYLHQQISFEIRDGATDFIVGDTFTIAVTVGARECVAVDSSLANGAQNPFGVLAEDVDTTDGPLPSGCYRTGKFNRDYLYFGGVDTVATHEAAMAQLSMFVADTVPFPGESVV